MSQENVEIVRSLSEPFDGIDVAEIDWGGEPIRELLGRACSPDVVLSTLASAPGLGVDDVYRGLDGLVRYLQGWVEPFSEYRVTYLDYIEAGDCVLVPIRARGVGGTSGAPVEIELTILYELREGQIVRIEQYDTLDDARQAAERS